jgi:hypothetical protein
MRCHGVQKGKSGTQREIATVPGSAAAGSAASLDQWENSQPKIVSSKYLKDLTQRNGHNRQKRPDRSSNYVLGADQCSGPPFYGRSGRICTAKLRDAN